MTRIANAAVLVGSLIKMASGYPTAPLICAGASGRLRSQSSLRYQRRAVCSLSIILQTAISLKKIVNVQGLAAYFLSVFPFGNVCSRKLRLLSIAGFSVPINESSKTLIFLSHSVADEKLVEAFETLLCKALNITSARIFCSSLEGQGVTKGTNFVDAIKDKAIEAEAVISLLSPAYMESPFCLAELGAAWVLNSHRFPIIVPPNTFEIMQGTLLGVTAVKIDKTEALTQMFEDIGEALSLAPPKAAVRARAIRDFVKSWPVLKKSVGKAKRVDVSIHKKALEDAERAREAWEATEQELEKIKAYSEALEKTKDATAVAKIRQEFGDSNWEMDLENAISEFSDIVDEVGGRRVLRLMILELLGKPSYPDLNDDFMDRAVEIDVYDPVNKTWNRSSDEFDALRKAMAKVDAVFEEHENASSELKRQKKRNKTDDIRFWEQQLRL
ncbi:hypothetical protein FHW19_004513 [Ochrobactrum anthropi]|uniref:toll/interleukin-1 receptor domain-containing protein n=1 Tax=Brucella anthropi TaxID=529 RepID=UPI0015FA5D8E|nr:toll/interleukin-1 receptor domain-containing protein [Brucella anthropi]MBA8862762.1 hypothetical protein [Brucella anthropi]